MTEESSDSSSFVQDCLQRILGCFDRECNPPRSSGSSEGKDEVARSGSARFTEGNIDEHFATFLIQFELSEEKQNELLAQPWQKKKELLQRQHQCSDGEESVPWLLGVISRLSGVLSLSSPSPEADLLLSQLQDVVVFLRTQKQDFLDAFLSSEGIPRLSSLLLSASRVDSSYSARIAFSLLIGVRALLNSNRGREAVLSSPECLLSIVASFDLHDIRCKICALEVLSALCFVPEDGHRLVLSALTQATSLLGERTRLQRVVEMLHRSCASGHATDRLRTASLSLINALLRTGPAESSTEFRLHLRCELLMLGVDEILHRIRADASPRLDDHIDLFEMMRREDELSLGRSEREDDSGSSSPLDFESASGMAEALSARLSHSVALSHFISLLQHLFMLPSDEKHLPLWRFYDLLLQHLCLQSSLHGVSSTLPDVHPGIPVIDMDDVLSRLHTHCEYERVESELARVQEQLKEEKTRTEQLEKRLQEDCASFDSGAPESPSSLSFSTRADLEERESLSSLLPPIRPPSSLPPPPPPPPLPNSTVFLKDPAATLSANKKVPPPTTTLKTLNWKKISKEKAAGTVWEFIEEEGMYKQLNLTDLSANFMGVVGQKEDDSETIPGTLARRKRDCKICVIDARKAQNCTIMLSRLRMSNTEICRSIFAMDNRIPKEMIEQMLKFLPSPREKVQLLEVASRSSPSSLGVADRFLYEISQIPRSESRLRCLHTIRTFHERVELLLPSIQAVQRASMAVQNSHRFRHLLGLVLAIGNFLNYGKRLGDASGFELSSLLCLSELRNSLRADRSLLHWISAFLNDNYEDIAKLRVDLSPVIDAARFSKSEVVCELRSLEKGIKNVEAEVESAKAKEERGRDKETLQEDDPFFSISDTFLRMAKEEFDSLEKAYYGMLSKYSECCRSFCVDSSVVAPDDFFGVLSRFLSQLTESQQQVWLENEQKLQVKRQTIARSYFARKNRRREKESNFEQLISALQSGQLFSDELSRLRTSLRLPKKSSKKASAPNS